MVITGASGFIGKNLIQALNKKYRIIALVRQDSNVENLDDCEIYRYIDTKNLADFLATKMHILGVIHLATLYLKNHNANDVKNLIDSNITFGSEVCQALAMIEFQGWFINVGTFWQFYKNMPNNPLNLYAASKSAFNSIIDFYANTTNITFTSMFLNDTYGPNDTRNKIFNIWINMKEGEILEMSGGMQLIDLIYIDDIIDAFKVLIDLLDSPYRNLAENKRFALHSKERKTLRELADIFQKITNKKLDIRWGAKPYMERENFIPFEGGDTLPNWKEKTSFEIGIKKLIDENGGGWHKNIK
ncbi:dTDP-glucose 4,6-dehydratase [Helicobacter sp. 16-1353]|nr:dTDP-glucose 4,6-dehydratase [Helicobacter sp. 16-1353]